MKPSGLYIHIPYCKSKCLYCDFFSTRSGHAEWDRLTQALASELESRADELESDPDTLYIGGGTPSLIPDKEFACLTESIRRTIRHPEHIKEFTIEVNPEDVSEEKCLSWKENGVSRVSMGIQSLNDRELSALGRKHDGETALKALGILKRHFGNISVDVMFGLPHQTVESISSTLSGIIDFHPQHISAYSLMFEERTPFTVLRDQGRLSFPDERETLLMWETIRERLASEGYGHYEISNYALPGFESIHNRKYWTGNPYLGIGPSAHSYDGRRVRRANPWKIKEYIDHFSGHGGKTDRDLVFHTEEILTDEELRMERIMLGMRTREGIDLGSFRNDFGEVATAALLRNADKPVGDGLLKMMEDSISLTRQGIMVSDDVILQLCM